MARFAANLSMLFTELPFVDRFAAARDAGFEGVEFAFPQGHSAQQIGQLLMLNGLQQVLANLPLEPGSKGLAAQIGRGAQFRQDFKLGLEYAVASGCEVLHVTTGTCSASQRQRGSAQFYQNISWALDQARVYGVELVLEAINQQDVPDYYVHSLNEAKRRAAQFSGLSVLLDLYHASMEGIKPLVAIGQIKNHLGHVQIAGFPGRHEPDSGAYNLNEIIKELDEQGYEGWIGCEYNPRLGTGEGLGWFNDFKGQQEEAASLKPQTLYDKLWHSHVIDTAEDDQALLYIDRHLINEVTSPQAFAGLRLSGRRVWRPHSIIATADHNISTDPNECEPGDEVSRAQLEALHSNIQQSGAKAYFPYRHKDQGIVHIVGPEMGATQPGMTIVCGDSHTSTHGAFAALAFGIGTSDVEHVLSTQTLSMRKAKTFAITIEGELPVGVYAKDLALAVIAKIGSAGALGHVIEFRGSTIQALSMEARMTLCNMAVEAGARTGLVAVDQVTLDYLQDRKFSPSHEDWPRAVEYWKTLFSDSDAHFDREVLIDAGLVKPMVSWGTSPEMATSIDGQVPDPALENDPIKRQGLERALNYMDLAPGTNLPEIFIDKVFIGSCTNARIEDLRLAAAVVNGRHIAENIKLALVVPGSGAVKRQAEKEGLHRIFKEAGFLWREPGCSMCLGMNADRLLEGERCASTSNRNFEGRQGKGGRSHLMSPVMAAMAGIKGHLCDVSHELA